MHSPELVIRGHRVVTSRGVGPAAIHISRGVISSVSAIDDVPAGCDVIDAAPESLVMDL